MIVKRLKIRNFRNYEKADITFNSGMNIISGKNAQGKTNFLEALVYLSLTRSHRIADDRKLIKEEQPFADIACTVQNKSEIDLEAVIYSRGKTLMIHHNPVKKSSEFVGLLNVVLFAPDDLRIFTDAPRERRRIMNQEITKVSRSYLLSLNRYQSLLKDRNLLLKTFNPDCALLDTLDEQMSEEEVRILTERRKFVSKINETLSSLYKELSGEDTDVFLKYRQCIQAEENIEEALLSMHKESRSRDLENHVTSVGIHHDDLIFEMNGKNLIQIASQGQKRMTMLAFKMSLLGYIQSVTETEPVLLLDDVLSELDVDRQKKLMEMVSRSCQCIITATEVPAYIYKRTKIFHVEHGMIQEVNGGNA